MRNKKYQAAPTPTTNNQSPQHNHKEQPLPTFLDHIHELRRRLFWVVGVIIVVSSCAYPFLGNIINILTYPLGNQQLFYLTPIGGLSFAIKLCIYVGVLIAVPVFMYHLYRFLEPLMGNVRKSAIFYVGLSSSLAIAGILFAYFVSLPGALHFLTGFNLNKIQAMLTVDSYLSFVVTYLLGAALLFQIPLLMLIINTLTPLKPGKLMKMQRYVVVAAFLIAAVISPTPDIMNQTLFALPIIAMYELGALMVVVQRRRAAKRALRQQYALAPTDEPGIPDMVLRDLTQEVAISPQPLQRRQTVIPPQTMPAQLKPQNHLRPARTVSDFVVRPRVTTGHNAVTPRAPKAITSPRTDQKIRVPQRSLDGFIIAKQIPASMP